MILWFRVSNKSLLLTFPTYVNVLLRNTFPIKLEARVEMVGGTVPIKFRFEVGSEAVAKTTILTEIRGYRVIGELG